MKHRVFLTAAISALALAACGESEVETTNETAATAETTSASAGAGGMPSAEVPAAIRNAPMPEGDGDALLENLAAMEGAERTESGLVIQTLEAGSGPTPDAEDLLKLHFVARLPGQDEPFESSYANGMPVIVTAQQTLPGWAEAVQQLQEGAIARIGVPPSLAFGAQGMPGGPVGPNQVTVYDLELVEVYEADDDAALASLAEEAQARIQELSQQAQRQQSLAQQQFSALAAANRARSTLFINEQAERAETQVTDSGLVYEVVEDGGEGETPSLGDTVEVNYRGTLPSGEVFDSSYERGQTSSFTLGEVIEGWNQGLQLMNVGDTYRFYIPANLAYGQQGTRGGPIGPNQALIFDVELVSVSEGEAEAEGGNQ